ncbi:MAG: tetraacyldisaccharide 4'-kinase [Gammaproteobacteria bacterium]|nr:tetraacyldisaccharide 4'-kinase [Gammaproteobacteria bacterium]
MHVLETHWQRATLLSTLLLPLSWWYCAVVGARRYAYRRGWIKSERLAVPVIVVGNLTVGGTGKTPLVAWLAEFLRDAGFHPGIVTRGYGGRAANWPRLVEPNADPDQVGDEPVLLARRTRCPVAAGPDRAAAGRLLLQERRCDVVVSDDGLQHYRLARDIEIAVIDGARRFGNGRCLPAGPLRERIGRLSEVDIRVTNGAPAADELGMQLVPVGFRELVSGRVEARLPALAGPLHALAGIGQPPRFFRQLRALGLAIVEHAFPDHHHYTAADLAFAENVSLLMTEKDAVKCERFARPGWWAMAVDARPDDRLGAAVLKLLKEKTGG